MKAAVDSMFKPAVANGMTTGGQVDWQDNGANRDQGQRIPVCKAGTVSGPPGCQSVTSGLIVFRMNQIKPKQNKISQTWELTSMFSFIYSFRYHLFLPPVCTRHCAGHDVIKRGKLSEAEGSTCTKAQWYQESMYKKKQLDPRRLGRWR